MLRVTVKFVDVNGLQVAAANHPEYAAPPAPELFAADPNDPRVRCWRQGAPMAGNQVDSPILEGFEDLADILSSAFPFLVSPEEVRREAQRAQEAAADNWCGCSI